MTEYKRVYLLRVILAAGHCYSIEFDGVKTHGACPIEIIDKIWANWNNRQPFQSFTWTDFTGRGSWDIFTVWNEIIALWTISYLSASSEEFLPSNCEYLSVDRFSVDKINDL